MLGKKLVYTLLIILNTVFICLGEHEVCKATPFVSCFPETTGISDFGKSSDDYPKYLTETFVSIFTDIVQKSDALTNLFDISQTTPTDFRKFIHDYVKASATNLGMEFPHTSADIASKPVEDYFQTLIPNVIVNVFANFAAKYLQSEGVLNPMNAASLAASYADIFTGIAKENVSQDNPQSKLKALLDGVEKFFKSVGLFAAEKGEKIASTFADAVKLAAMELPKAGISDFNLSSAYNSKSLAETFVSTFTNTIKNSDVLTNLFEISQTTPKDFRNFMYDYIKASASNLGMENPHTIADTAAKAVEENFETLVPAVMAKVFANTAAKHLQSEGLLNPMNAASLALSYADALTETAKENVNLSNQESKLKALMDGIEKFFKSMDLLVGDKGQIIASTFANEVKLAAMELRKGDEIYTIN